MQTTLLGLGIAIILAIVAALLAPFVVDWSHYRSAFEAEASRLSGMNVRVNGKIDARILPTPLIKLRNVEAGEVGGEPQLRADTLELEVGLGPLLRGVVQASEVHLVAPEIRLGLDPSGAIDWPAVAPSFRPEALSVSRFNVENGRIVLSDAASGARIELQKLRFDGDIRSFAGPFNGEGTFVFAGEPYAYRISGGHVEGDSGLKIRLGVDPSNRPLTTNVEGTITLDRGVPQFDGVLTLARPVGVTLANGQRVMSDPWHAAGEIEITRTAASLRDFAFQYGPDERPLNFAGKATLALGTHPHLDGTVTALQIDVDRALADPDITRQPPLLIIKNFLEGFVATATLPVPADIGVGIDAVTVGETTIQSLRGTMHFDAAGWILRDVDFRAPGLTHVSLSGRLGDSSRGFAFNGPAAIESADVEMALAWLRSRGAQPPGLSKPFNARGDIVVVGDRLAVDKLSASLDQENVEGRLAYTWATGDRPAVLDADLHAAKLDLDAMAAFGKTAAAYGLELPRQGSLALDIGKATWAGVDTHGINARLKFDGGALQIDKLVIGELGGAAIDISGRIDELSSRPRGKVALDLDARALDGLTDLAGQFAPQAADVLRRFVDRLAPAKVHATLAVTPAASGSTATLEAKAQLGLLRLALNGDASGEPSRLGDANIRVEGRLDADDGSALVTLFGLDRVLAVDQLPGSMTLSAAGSLDGDLRLEGQAAASGFSGAARGTLRLGGEKPPTGSFQLLTQVADWGPLSQAMTGQSDTVAPVSARAALSVAGANLSFDQLAIVVGKSSLHGHLSVAVANPIAIDGELNADSADAAHVSALLLGLPRAPPDAGTVWSNAPLGSGAFAAVSGAVRFKIDHAAFTPAVVVKDLSGVARFAPSRIALENVGGSLAGGRIGGEFMFHRNAGSMVAHGRFDLAGADVAALLASRRQAIGGKMALKLEGDGIGADPMALVRALQGTGTLSLTNAEISGLDGAAFEAAMRVADQSGAIEAPKIRAAVSEAIANGTLVVPQADASVTIGGGKFGLTNAVLKTQDGAALVISGTLGLGNGAVDARATFSRDPPAHALIRLRPEFAVLLKGPLASPEATLDTAAMTGWLTLRAAELQSRRLESLEANRRADVIGPARRPEPPVVRMPPTGSLVESDISASVPVASSTRGIDRLQPQTPPAIPPLPASPPPAPPAATPPAPAPHTAGPDKRSPLDLLFHPQN